MSIKVKVKGSEVQGVIFFPGNWVKTRRVVKGGFAPDQLFRAKSPWLSHLLFAFCADILFTFC